MDEVVVLPRDQGHQLHGRDLLIAQAHAALLLELLESAALSRTCGSDGDGAAFLFELFRFPFPVELLPTDAGNGEGCFLVCLDLTFFGEN